MNNIIGNTSTTAAHKLSNVSDCSTYATISTIGNCTTTNGNYVIGNTTPGWSTIGYSDNPGLFYSPTDISDFVMYLNDDELKELLEKIRERSEESQFKQFITTIVRNRHFSESFLMEYISLLDESTVMSRHSADIKSQSYPEVALFLEGKKLC